MDGTILFRKVSKKEFQDHWDSEMKPHDEDLTRRSVDEEQDVTAS